MWSACNGLKKNDAWSVSTNVFLILNPVLKVFILKGSVSAATVYGTDGVALCGVEYVDTLDGCARDEPLAENGSAAVVLSRP